MTNGRYKPVKTFKYWNTGDILDFCGIIHTEKRQKGQKNSMNNWIFWMKKDMRQIFMPNGSKGLLLSDHTVIKLISEKEWMNRHAKFKDACDNS